MQTLISSLTNIDSATSRPISQHRGTREWKKDSADSSDPYLLVQYDISWYEQTILRMLHIPYIVKNSTYNSTASTGALPYLVDQSNGVMIGRRHPDMQGKSFTAAKKDHHNYYDSDIIGYLSAIGHDPDAHLSEINRNDCLAYSALIRNELQPLLNALRFGDKNTYERTYKAFAMNACKGGNTLSDLIIPRVQVWSERKSKISELRQNNLISCRGRLFNQGRYEVNVAEAVHLASKIYDSIDSRLSNQSFLVESSQASSADALLFSHLCEAASNVHLLPLFQIKSNLKRFYSMMHEMYFTENLIGDFDKNDAKSLFRQSSTANRSNIFYQPLVDSLANVPISLKEPLSLELAAKADSEAGENWERFRLGGALLPNKVIETGNDQKDKIMKQNEDYDSMWLSAVFTTSVLFLATLTNGGLSD